MSPVTEEPLAAGREAAARGAWREAYEQLASVDRDGALAGDDLAALAEAAFWSGRLQEALSARERAFAALAAEGRPDEAAQVAVKLAVDHVTKGAIALASGWIAKAERLVADLPESRAHAPLEAARAMVAMFAGRLDDALTHAERAAELGRRLGDRDAEALGHVMAGRLLVLQGRYDEGLKLLDEASTAALVGELGPYSSCFVYCTTITSCHGVGDYYRARQWTDAASRWCADERSAGFPGACRVHRSEILRLGGDWEGAEAEALDACGELETYDVWTTAVGYYQIGEIRRRRGDFGAAEEAYRKARELGREPQPGLALLRLAQGKVDEAAAGLRRSLDEGSVEPLARSRRLPAQVEVSLARGDLDAARAAAAELAEIADRVRIAGRRTPLLEGPLELAQGQIALAEEDWPRAEGCLRRALEIWSRIGAPYEAAKARMGLGMAYAKLRDEAGARDELTEAKATFARLGAVLDQHRAMELLGEAKARRTFLFSDIVGSTRLLEALGDGKWAKLLDRHDAILRGAIEDGGGEVIKHTGDGFFAAFETPAAAVAAAGAIQRELEDEFVSVRIGLHSGDALERGNDYAGIGVNLAARVGARAGAGEILATAETLAGEAYAASAPRLEELKGFAEPVEVVTLDWRR